MKTRTPTLSARIVGTVVIASAACGGGSPLQTMDAGGGGNPQSADAVLNAKVAACDHYFSAQYLRCGGPRLPDEEIARIRGRFELFCQNEIALPGSGLSAETVDACAATLDVSPCELPEGPPLACQFRGSLPSGAACTDDIQCASGSCDDGVLATPEGPTGPPKCGTCRGGAVTVGQVCAHDNFSAGCPTGSICLTADTSAALPTYTCTAVVEGDVGAVCDDIAASCKPGLYCAGGRCAQLAGAGAPCGEGVLTHSEPGGCAAPLGCEGVGAEATCTSGAVGASCLNDFDCSVGLGCVPVGACATGGQTARIGCSQSGQCVAISWAESGQPCTLATRCRIGSCVFGGGFAPEAQNMDGSLAAGVCPMLVPDGQPCRTGTCDTFSACFAGKCGLVDSVVCK